MTIKLPIDISNVKGFLADDEAEALYQAALEASSRGPVLEIGSYCGKSTLYLAAACRQNDSVVYALDHHRGSEEHQKGEFFHDPDLYDGESEQLDSFREFRKNISAAGYNDIVIPLVASSEVASKNWSTFLSLVFIDGGHSLDAALTDYRCWASQVIRGGILAIHDIFKEASEGGQAPYTIWQMALNSGLFEEIKLVNSLGLLRRL
jgi:predicted O-methyltransferase YrrM